MHRLKLTVAYDGTDYAGWQFQPGQATIQGEMERAWREITGEVVRLTASGRTDAGVHALGQVVSVETASKLSPEQLQKGVNAKLPDGIVVVAAEPAGANFHATYDAVRKTYRYQIHNSRLRPLLDRRYVWHYPFAELDIEAMRRGADAMIGRYDFACFETAGSQRATSIRTITRMEVTREAERVSIQVQGDGFLYNMVRAIAGTLVEVGRGTRQPEWVAEVIASRDRRKAGPNAPALGLVLVEVEY